MQHHDDVPPDTSGAPSRLTLSGDLDIYAAAGIEREFDKLAGPRIVIDMRGVRSVSASFFSALVRLRWRLNESRIEVHGTSQNVRRTFRAVGADVLVVVR